MFYQLIYNIIKNAVSDKIDYANILCPQPSLKYYVYIQNKINEFFIILINSFMQLMYQFW